MPTTEKQRIGKIGEDIACEFLEKRGFSIVERNYLKKQGEIDIIAENKGVFHFVEVKTVSRENISDVSYETNKMFSRETLHRPEENVHPMKMARIAKTIQIYLSEKRIPSEKKWQFDVLAIVIHETTKQARVRFLENIIL